VCSGCWPNDSRARAWPCLRFDYHATGDSPGADEEGDLVGWVGDVRRRLRELVARSGARRVVCVGARLGRRARPSAPRVRLARATRLVLWDPRSSAAKTISRLLRVKHVEALESTFSVPDPPWAEKLANDPTAFADEAIGFAISPALRQQIRQLGPHSLPLAPGVAVHVLAHPDDAAVNNWFATLSARGIEGNRWPLEESFDWTAGERRNSPIVPGPALARLMSTIRD
jgi:hypothetical protein